MSISQPTTSLLDTARTVGPNEQIEAAVPFQDTAPALQRAQTTAQHGFKDDTTETIVQLGRARCPFAASPAWPMSQSGPEATSPFTGQKLHSLHTNQMVYECDDQERGMPDVPSVTRGAWKGRTRTFLPDTSFQVVVSEAEAMERWLNDDRTSEKEAMEQWLDEGGASAHEAVFGRGGVSPLRMMRL